MENVQKERAPDVAIVVAVSSFIFFFNIIQSTYVRKQMYHSIAYCLLFFVHILNLLVTFLFLFFHLP